MTVVVVSCKRALHKSLAHPSSASQFNPRKTLLSFLASDGILGSDLEFRITWVGSAKSEEHDQILDEVRMHSCLLFGAH
jgi:hypothetical protein